ncbi:MAG: MFS transporter [Candidatus Sericytochromatia bacterium]|nr:MFS transporter [Candidatus Sericytochromatia bacterium]
MSNSFSLLGTRRFAPLFWAQFLGSFNDNILKQALVLLITFQGVTVWGVPAAQMGTFATALLVLPYFFFSSLAGQIADKYPKTLLIQRFKLWEVILMAIAAVGFWFHLSGLLLAVLFLVGTQATFFGPLKYSALPQYLRDDELVAGNALVEGGTNLSILLGGVVGGLLIAAHAPLAGSAVEVGSAVIALLLPVLALIGWGATLALPAVASEAPDLRIDWNPFTTTWRICAATAHEKGLWNSILGISWLWTFGFAFLGLMTPWVKDSLRADESVAVLFLALFSVGVGVGSVVCERLSFNKLELGLVPLGSLGVSVFTLDLAWAAGSASQLASQAAGTQTAGTLLAHPANWRVMADLFLIATFAGIFLVPLYTALQSWARPEMRSRVIAANNIVNALFIVAYAPLQMKLIHLTAQGPSAGGLALTIPHIFVMLALVNAAVAIYIYTLIPEFTLRFQGWLITRLAYRLHVHGVHHVPETGGALLICNHPSFIDWLFIGAAIRRPVHFVMWAGFARHPLMKRLVHDAKIIPIYPAKEDPEVLNRAMDQIAADLAAGELVCIFPEGEITKDGRLMPFRTGVERIVARTPVPVVPVGLRGLWGSYFSYAGGRALSQPFRRGAWSRVDLYFSAPVPPEAVKADDLRKTVAAMIGEDLTAVVPVAVEASAGEPSLGAAATGAATEAAPGEPTHGDG